MKGASAPQTGDFKTGLNVGRAQVGNLSQLNQRMNELTDRALDDKKEKEKEKKALEDKFLESTDTSGMWQDEVPDILDDINTLYETTDMRLYTTDAKYRAEQNQKLNNIKSGVAFSVADKQKYQDDLKLWKENPDKYEKPELNDYVQGSGKGGNYGAFAKTKDLVPKHQYSEELPDILEELRKNRDTNVDAYANELRSGTTTILALDEQTLKATIKSRQDDPTKRADFIARMKSLGIEADDTTPEGKQKINDYIDKTIRDLASAESKSETAQARTSKETGGTTRKEKELYNTIYWDVQDALDGKTANLQEVKGQPVPGKKGQFYGVPVYNPETQMYDIPIMQEQSVQKTDDDGNITTVKEFAESEEPVSLNRDQMEATLTQTYGDKLGVKVSVSIAKQYSYEQFRQTPNTQVVSDNQGMTAVSMGTDEDKNIVYNKDGKTIKSSNAGKDFNEFRNQIRQNDEDDIGQEDLTSEDMERFFGTNGVGTKDDFMWDPDNQWSSNLFDTGVDMSRDYWYKGTEYTLDTSDEKSMNSFLKRMNTLPERFTYFSKTKQKTSYTIPDSPQAFFRNPTQWNNKSVGEKVGKALISKGQRTGKLSDGSTYEIIPEEGYKVEIYSQKG